MNCLDVHRILSTDSSHNKLELEAHLATCSSCAKFAVEIQQFEAVLNETLHVDVPDGLADRIILSKSMEAKQDKRQRRKSYFAIAASLFLTVNLVGGLLYINTPYALDQVALRHVADEAHHLYENNNIQLAQVNNILRTLNVRLDKNIGKATYAGLCPIRKYRGGHIVMQGKKAPVTLLLMPGEYVSRQERMNNAEFNGVILPIENGSVAIISKDKMDLEHYTRAVKQSLHVI